MGAFVPISYGELLDKITILEIKQARLTDKAALANVSRELSVLLETSEPLEQQHSDLPGLRARLREINEALWDIEDRIRAKEAQAEFGAEFVELARSVYRTNDQRSAVKREINAVLGSDLVEEKQYTAY